MSVDVGSAVGYLDLDISGFLEGLRTAQSEAQAKSKKITETIGRDVQTIGSKISSAGSALTKSVSLPLVGAGGAAFKFANDFETSLAKVRTIADATKKPISAIKTEVVDLSNETGMAASDLAEAAYQAISAGVDTASAVDFVRSSTKLAKAGFTDTTTAVDTLTTIINAYGLSSKDAAHISDVLISTQNKGKTTVNELGQSIGKIIPTANAMGVSLEDLGTSYSYLTAGGIATAESTTYLNGMFNELGKGGTKVSDILIERTGKGFKELMEDGYSLRSTLEILKNEADETGVGFNDLWGSQEAGKAALSLLNTSTEDYEATLKDFQETVGDTNSAYEIMADTTESKLAVATENGRNALIKLGDTIKGMLIPIIESATEWLKKINDWLNSLSEEEKEHIVKVGLAVIAIGPLVTIFGKLTSGIGGAVSAFGKISSLFSASGSSASVATAAFGGVSGAALGVVSAIGVLIAAFATLWKKSEEFREKITGIWKSIKDKISGFCDGIVERVNDLGYNFESVTEILSAVWNKFCELLEPLFTGAFEMISVKLSGFLDIFLNILDVFIGLFTGDWEQLWEGVKGIFSSAWETIKGTFTTSINFIKNTADVVLGWFGSSWNNVWTGVKTFFTDTWNSISSFFSNTMSKIKSSVSSFVGSITGFFSEIPKNVGNFVSDAYDKVFTWGSNMVMKAKEIGEGFVKGFTNFFKNLPDNIFNLTTKAWETIKGWGTSIYNTAVEAGSDFVSGVKNTMSNLPSTVKGFLDNTIGKLGSWVVDMGKKGVEGIKNLIRSIKNAAKNIGNEMLSIGNDIVKGVWEGIKNAASWFTDKIGGFFSGIVSDVKGFLGIGSPSKVFANEIGHWLPPGIAKGFEAAMPGAMRSMKENLDDSIDGIGPGNIDVEIGGTVNDVSSTLKSAYDKFAIWYESIEARVAKSSENMVNYLREMMYYGMSVLNDDGTLGYVKYGGFGNSGVDYVSRDKDNKDKDKNVGNGDTFIFNSPKPIDEIEAAKQMKKTKQDIAEGF